MEVHAEGHRGERGLDAGAGAEEWKISSNDSARLEELATRPVRGPAALSERATERNDDTDGALVGSNTGHIWSLFFILRSVLSFILRSA